MSVGREIVKPGQLTEEKSQECARGKTKSGNSGDVCEAMQSRAALEEPSRRSRKGPVRCSEALAIRG